MNHSPNYQWGERVLALPPGRWVNRAGGVKVYEEAQPELDFGITDGDEQLLWDAMARHFAAHPFVDDRPVTGVICDDCGCLLAPGERCPGCLVWAIRDAERHAWAVASKANRHRIWDILNSRKAA